MKCIIPKLNFPSFSIKYPFISLLMFSGTAIKVPIGLVYINTHSECNMRSLKNVFQLIRRTNCMEFSLYTARWR